LFLGYSVSHFLGYFAISLKNQGKLAVEVARPMARQWSLIDVTFTNPGMPRLVVGR
jgi:hypothetical protein